MIGRLEPKHWALILGFVASTATVTAGLDHWGDVMHPAVLSGLVVQFATMLGAIFAGAPPNPNITASEHPGRRATDPQPPVDMGSVSDAKRSEL